MSRFVPAEGYRRVLVRLIVAVAVATALAVTVETLSVSAQHDTDPVPRGQSSCTSKATARSGGASTAGGSPTAAEHVAADSYPDIPAPPTGQKLVFADDFDGNKLDCARWTELRGQPKSSHVAYWLPSQVSVGGGVVRLRTSWDAAMHRYVSGGLSTVHDPAGVQEYGTYLMRFRMSVGVGVGDVALLYPADGRWPPEIDMTESGGSRKVSVATLHYGTNNSEVHRSIDTDFTQWHVAGVRWEPGLLTFTLDGHAYATIRSSEVPREAMWFGVQTQESPCPAGVPASCRSADTPAVVDLDIDWVAIYH